MVKTKTKMKMEMHRLESFVWFRLGYIGIWNWLEEEVK